MKNLGGRKYCLECSPFNQNNTRQLHVSSPVMIGKKYCPRCKQEKSKSCFYLRRKGNDFSAYCKSCTLDENKERRYEFKNKCVEYKGGKCKHCGYNKCNDAFDFHHKIATEKDFSISHVKLTSFNDRVKKELDKCELLCSNCHREEHARMVKLDIM